MNVRPRRATEAAHDHVDKLLDPAAARLAICEERVKALANAGIIQIFIEVRNWLRRHAEAVLHRIGRAEKVEEVAHRVRRRARKPLGHLSALGGTALI